MLSGERRNPGETTSIPMIQQYRVAKYLMQKKLSGEKRFPLVLMLEPLFQCNLACAGCGKIDYPKETLQKRLSVEEALTENFTFPNPL